MDKKIAIMTFINTWNVGAELQAFALAKALKKNFPQVDIEIMNYSNPHISMQYQPLRLSNHINSVKRIIKYFLVSNVINKKDELFVRFKEEHLPISKKKYDAVNLKEANEDYSSFIVGSDQVWNTKLTNEDYTYTLNFVNDCEKKNSYAASFGQIELIHEHKDLWKKNLSDFRVLSSREEESTKLLNELLKTDEVETVVDPTLLLSKKEWLDFFPRIEKRIHDRKYILVYTVSEGEHIFKFARYLAEKYGYDIIFLNNSWKKKRKVLNVRVFGPVEFLQYIFGAEIVLITSFHGLIFSTIFEKNFYCDLTEHSVTGSLRLRNLLKKIDLENRIIVPDRKIEENKIDYINVSKIIQKEKKNSFEVLKKIIG